jgi:5-methylcytosine-specific restriction enzyme A
MTARWYGSQRWRRRAQQQLRNHPLCAFCDRQGRVEAAVAADHVVPHKGDEAAFWTGELQSLCLPHHNGTKREQERKGYCTDIGLDGMPIDPNHPINRRR